MILNTSKILYPNNIEKPISDVNIGDIIIGYSEKTEEFVEVEVLSKKSKEYDKIIQLTFEDDSILKITEEHPILTKEGWASYNIEESKKRYHVDCLEIKVGCEVLTKENTYKIVKDINVLNEKTTCYTLNVTDEIDTYVVEGVVVHNVPLDCEINIKPTNLTDLRFYSNKNTYTLSDFELYNGWLYLNFYVTQGESTTFTIESTGYKTQEVQVYEGGGGPQVILEPNPTITCTRDSSKDTQDIYYTKSSTPAVGDVIYNSNKQDSGKTVSAVGSGYIEFVDNVTLTINQTSYELTQLKVGINGTEYDLPPGVNNLSCTPGQQIMLYIGCYSYFQTSAQVTNSSDTSCVNNGLYSEDISTERIDFDPFIMPNNGLSFDINVYLICCVPYYSNIMMSDGTTSLAEDVKVGDKLLGYNEESERLEEVVVKKVIHKVRNDIVKVIFEDDSLLELTPDHPVLTNNGWAAYQTKSLYNKENIDVHELSLSDKVLQKDGTYKKIKSIKLNMLDKAIDVYTFDVTDTVNTFLVENCILHNAPC